MPNDLSSITGGEVTGILLEGTLRLAAMAGSLNVPGVSELLTGELSNRAYIGYAGIPVHTRKQEVYRYPAEVVQHTLESGAKVSDHVILLPAKLSLVFEVSNWVPGETIFIQEILEQIRAARNPITLLTEHKLLENMLMDDLVITNELPEWGKLNCSASFTHITWAEIEKQVVTEEKTTAVEGKTGGEDVSKSATDLVDNGKTELEDTSSFAKKLGGGAYETLTGWLQ